MAMLYSVPFLMDKLMTDITEIPKVNLTIDEQALVEIKANLAVHLEFQELNAKFIKAKYDALIVEGFSELQALELCKQ